MNFFKFFKRNKSNKVQPLEKSCSGFVSPLLPPPPPRIIPKMILAGNYREADAYARKQGWFGGSWGYINDANRLLGHRTIELHRTGTWYLRNDLEEIFEVLSRIERMYPKVEKKY
jgi:hypothetical protein